MPFLFCQEFQSVLSAEFPILACWKEDSVNPKASDKKKVKDNAPNIPEPRYWIVLKDTVLFPEGGGQPCDFGTIGTAKVLDVQKVPWSAITAPEIVSRLKEYIEDDTAPTVTASDVVVHYCDSPVEVATVKCTVDAARRHDHMTQHSAQHLISALADALFGFKTVGWMLQSDRSLIEVQHRDSDVDGGKGDDVDGGKEFSPEMVAELEGAVNGVIRSASSYSMKKVSREEALMEPILRSRGVPLAEDSLRLITIQGVDVATCCGTHVANSAQLQLVYFLPCEKTRGRKRLSFIAGGRALRALSLRSERERALCALFNCHGDDVVARTESLFDSAKQLRQENKNLKEEVSLTVASSLRDAYGGAARLNGLVSPPLTHRADADMAMLQDIAAKTCAMLGEQAPPGVLVLTGGADSGEGILFLRGVGHVLPDVVTRLGKAASGVMGGKGGGAKGTFQARVLHVERRLEATAAARES